MHGVMTLSSRGKSFVVVREPNGRRQRAYVNPKKQVASQPHRMTAPKEFREDERAETVFGRIMLNGHISPAQYEAGIAWAIQVNRFKRLLNSPSPNPRSVDPSRTSGGSDNELPGHVVEAIKKAYHAAFEALAAAGNRPQRTVNSIAVYDRFYEHGGIDQLKLGLDKLVDHFGIDPRLQISHVRSRS